MTLCMNRTLQALCRREIEKQSTFDLPFLHSEVFHKSLFGCVMEIAAYSLNKTSLLVRLFGMEGNPLEGKINQCVACVVDITAVPKDV